MKCQGDLCEEQPVYGCEHCGAPICDRHAFLSEMSDLAHTYCVNCYANLKMTFVGKMPIDGLGPGGK